MQSAELSVLSAHCCLPEYVCVESSDDGIMMYACKIREADGATGNHDKCFMVSNKNTLMVKV